MFGRLILETYVQDRCRDVRFKDEHLTWDDTEILYQIADNCGMIVADWIEREVEDGRN